MRAAVIGAGFYTTDQLLGAGFEVDLYDTLPTPFGLVRSGVAPDHPKLKSVTRIYEKTAAKPGFRFYGGVTLGRDVTREELVQRYDVVVYAIGTENANRLGIPGEDRPGSHSATEFVAWYNGHPDYSGHQFDLSGGRAVVIGNGNVALDVARMLVLDPSELAPTDTADHALEGFGASTVDEVILLGRRGPAQAAFTNPEVRELGELARADIVCHAAQIEGATEPETPTQRRNVELFRDYANREPSDKSHRIELRFLRSPVEILGDGDDGPVTGVRVAINRLENGRAVPTGEEEIIECGLVLRSIGYRGRPLDGVPFDDRRGLIRNEGGRVCRDDGSVCLGEYVVGWIKRGPSGVIGTNKKDAADTVAKIVEDRDAGLIGREPRPDADEIAEWLRERVPDAVTWEGWQAIDAVEKAAGEPQGRPRVKLVTLRELTEAGRLTPAR
jgi:ferredoxin--NADP+ reductase